MSALRTAYGVARHAWSPDDSWLAVVRERDEGVVCIDAESGAEVFEWDPPRFWRGVFLAAVSPEALLVVIDPAGRFLWVNRTIPGLSRDDVLAAITVSAGVAFTGLIAFIGLMVPHLVRLACGADHRIVLPGSVLLGGALLSASDLIARTVAAPAELPIGVVTSLIGAPFFLWLLRREES